MARTFTADPELAASSREALARASKAHKIARSIVASAHAAGIADQLTLDVIAAMPAAARQLAAEAAGQRTPSEETWRAVASLVDTWLRPGAYQPFTGVGKGCSVPGFTPTR